MMKLYAFIFLVCISSVLSAQTFQLYAEDFDLDYAGSFILNTAGPGDSIGTNSWIINDSYDGGFGYPNTTPQDSAVGGTIGLAPNSTYLHIYDEEGAPAITNASYDPSDPSDYMAQMAAGFCTLGLIDIEFTFFYLCEGSPTAYGQVYYSADGGPWTPIGEALYNDQHLWKYEVITDPVFENVQDLRFGFRWVNDDAGGDKTISFGIDDIIAVGTYDDATAGIDITIDYVFPDPVCALNTLIIGWSLSDPLCDGTYEVELSGPGGTFGSPDGLGVFTIFANDTVGAVAVIIPGTATEDICYKVRINRASPLPVITGEASVCFEVQDCPNEITTLQPVVTYDTNAVCINSVIDVPFYSTGVYAPGNVYEAQLSDSTGSFLISYSVIGTFTSSATYDPALGSPPGTVSGIVPTVPPGCNYKIRVVSSSPATTGTEFGTVCIQECDIETNNITDIYLCISEEVGDTITMPYDIHVFDEIAEYCDDNIFTVEVLDPVFFTQVSIDDLGFTVDTESGTIELMIPGYFDLVALGLDAGIWYLRVNATCADPYENSLGTLIHLTIGAPADDAPVLTPSDTLLCEGAVAYATIAPYNPNSQYQFQFGTGTPFIWPYNPIYIDFTGSTGDVTLRVREINYGCPGPWSEYITFHVIDVPVVAIAGPLQVCTGDTTTFSVPYFLSTYYDWTISGGTIVDTANNEIDVVWDETGVYTLTIFALNECGSGTGNKNITVIQTTPINDLPDQLICTGTVVNLNANTPGVTEYMWYIDSSNVWTDFYFTTAPDTTTTYVILAEDEEGCPSTDTITIFIENPEFETDTAEYCIGANTILDAGHPGSTYNWNTGENTQTITSGVAGNYTVTIDPPDKVCNITKTIILNEVIEGCPPIIYIPNAFSPNNDGVNDFTMLIGVAVSDLHLSIYNRWGELVYETNDINIINNTDIGWDGKQNGEDAEMGVYAYLLTATGEDGSVLQRKGNITLVR
ncbi:MAG: gliding motility-associated C-terminal domain-containing protein [Fimbriimonadaceae bacterium]|nr:gliding motility-associated C-terminal domain-containing protein [Chitinophagales bacterium]